MPNQSSNIPVPLDLSEKLTAPLFFIVSPQAIQASLMKSVLDKEFNSSTCCHTSLSLQAIVCQNTDRRCVYLLDCLNADLATIKKLVLIPARPPDHILVVLYNVEADDRLAPLVKRYKVRGIFFLEDSQATLIKGLKTILNGHLWLTRKMLATSISIQKAPFDKPSTLALDLLSCKEKEILKHIVAGECNQEIANAMEISVHTVKTHLYNIYKKIQVPNRLQAALWACEYI